MPWSEVSPGRFSRPFDSLENFYRAILATAIPIQREHFQIHSITRISPVPSPTELRHAWRTLRFRHPLIAGVDDGSSYIYEIPTASQLEAWLDDTVHFFGAVEQMTVDELVKAPQPSRAVEVFLFERTGQIVIRSSHWRMDGIGSMHLSNALLGALANPIRESDMCWTSQHTQPLLTPGIDEAIGALGNDTPERLQKAIGVLDIFVNNPSSMAFTTLPGQLPGATGRIHHKLSKEKSTQIIQGCKSRGLTVTVGIHASLILAGQRLAPVAPAVAQPSKYRYTDLITVSLRKFLPAPLDGSEAPVTLYHTGVPLTVDILDDAQCQTDGLGSLGASSLAFSQLAASLSGKYRDITRNVPSMIDYLPQWVNTIVAAFTTPPTPEGPPAPALPDLSSLGVVEDNIKHLYEGKKRFEVSEWYCIVEMLDKHIMCHCWTWDGQVNIQALWNEAFYDKSFVEQLMQEWEGIMQDELQ